MRTETRKKTALVLALASGLAPGLPQAAFAETTLRIGMTAADIPRTLGQPDQGFEGNRFTGLTMYDGLTLWDLSSADKARVLISGLGTARKVDEADKETCRSLEDVELHAARAARTCQERQLLGQGARSPCRQDGVAADAGGECAHRRSALRPGRLDRGAGAGRASRNQAARLRSLCQRGAACLAMAVLARRGLALERHPRPQSGQSLRRP